MTLFVELFCLPLTVLIIYWPESAANNQSLHSKPERFLFAIDFSFQCPYMLFKRGMKRQILLEGALLVCVGHGHTKHNY